jgi:hypothetical protein
MKINDKISSDLLTIVNVFNTYFTSVAGNFLNESIEGNNASKKSNVLFISSIWTVIFKDET